MKAASGMELIGNTTLLLFWSLYVLWLLLLSFYNFIISSNFCIFLSFSFSNFMVKAKIRSLLLRASVSLEWKFFILIIKKFDLADSDQKPCQVLNIIWYMLKLLPSIAFFSLVMIIYHPWTSFFVTKAIDVYDSINGFISAPFIFE